MENGAGSRSRTRDPLITNQVLYQLSYTGLPGIFAPDTGALADRCEVSQDLFHGPDGPPFGLGS